MDESGGAPQAGLQKAAAPAAPPKAVPVPAASATGPHAYGPPVWPA